MIPCLRSLLFDLFFYTFTTAYLVFFLPSAMLAPRKFVFILFRVWTRICLKMLEIIVGLRYTVRGREHLNAATENSACIIACKHQSAFDTIFISLYLDDIVIISKGQLAYIPLFGYYLKKLGTIFIDRENKTSAIRDLVKKSREAISQNRSLFIFPEGTRAKPGESLPYQRGISVLYRDLNVPVVPVALNTGSFWGRKSPYKKPGEIIIDIQPAIAPGLERNYFMDVLEETIETASTNLLIDTPTKRKKNWLKKLLILILGLSVIVTITGYFGVKILFDNKLNNAGIHFATSKIHFGLRTLPMYELTNVTFNSPALPGSIIMANSARITVTGFNKFTTEAKNINMQLYGNIFATISDLEAFIEPRSKKLSIPYMHAQNLTLKVGSFAATLNVIDGNYRQTPHAINFSCNTPRPAPADTPILLAKGSVEEKEAILKGEVTLQTTLGESFIDALQQQGLITATKANDLKRELAPIEHENNQNLKQMTIPISG